MPGGSARAGSHERRQAERRRPLGELAGVEYADFSTWKKEEQLAFWINAYNAFTVKRVPATTGTPRASAPARSAACIMPTPMRSFTLLAGLKNSII